VTSKCAISKLYLVDIRTPKWLYQIT